MFLASSTMLLLQVQYSLLVLFPKLAVLQAYLCSRRHSNVHLAKLIFIIYSEGTLIFISFCFIRFSSTKRSNNKQAGGITFSQILKDRWSWHQKMDISVCEIITDLELFQKYLCCVIFAAKLCWGCDELLLLRKIMLSW